MGNSQALKETALVEAFNLKAAIEMMTKNTPAAAEALAEMPPRYEGCCCRLPAAVLKGRLV